MTPKQKDLTVGSNVGFVEQLGIRHNWTNHSHFSMKEKKLTQKKFLETLRKT
ncbi:MAG: hypothetical protein CM15mV37_0600 [uncultured marine virus]|nr:MAG: hypothetical protein CM15mV37_0600 [uncultured marine virus]